MDKSTEFSEKKLRQTRSAFLWTSILRAPFWAIYNLLLFILYKELHATAFQIALFIALKPVVSIFSMYWGAYINQRPDRLISNVIWAGIIGYVPFLFFPIFYNASYVLFASALYMMMLRGVIPAWMEIFKLNLPGNVKHRVYSYGSILSQVVGGLLPLIIGPLLDHSPLFWRWIFVVTALCALFAVFFQSKIPIEIKHLPKPALASLSIKGHLFDPWKRAWKLLRSRSDFRAYQMGFIVLGGSGLMLMQPALPKFFIDALGLSYTELSIALTLCKGIGFALTSPLWAERMPKMDLYRFSGWVNILGFLFPIILIFAQVHVFWIYLAYLTYGIMQAGSELSWHLSGPVFAKEEDSTLFSGVNVLAVGLRGCIVPQLGTLLCLFASSATVLLMGGILCLLGMGWLLLFRQRNAYARNIQG